MTDNSKVNGASHTAEIEEANVDFYRDFANKYEDYEHCVFDPCYQDMLIGDIDFIATQLEGRPAPSCLDCGGGTGNISLKLLDRGWSVNVVDVSTEMLNILRERCSTRENQPRIEICSLGDFFEKNQARFDLITFGSVLHHLYSYKDVVSAAADALKPGGIIYTAYDPIIPRSRFLAGICSSLDTLAAKLLFDRADLLPGLARRIRKLGMKSSDRHHRAVASAGDLAEYHAKTGIDDSAVLELLEGKGFRILRHVRYPHGRTRLSRCISSAFEACQSCRIVAQNA